MLWNTDVGRALDRERWSVAGVILQANNDPDALSIGMPVYNDVPGGVRRAKADALATKNVLGLVVDDTAGPSLPVHVAACGVVRATEAQWDAVTGGSGGLVPLARYFLDHAAAGRLTATPPSASGHFLVAVGVAASSTLLRLRFQLDIQL